MRKYKFCLRLSLLIMGIWVLTASGEGNTNPVFNSFLTKDQNTLTPSTQFTFSDRISLQTVWTGLTGTHEETVLWIQPGGQPHEKIQFKFIVPSGNSDYRTSACCLNFRKKRFFLSAKQIKYIGTWRAQLFLDGKLLSEYPFIVS